MGTSPVLLYNVVLTSTSYNVVIIAWEQMFRTRHCPDMKNRPSINEITVPIQPKPA